MVLGSKGSWWFFVPGRNPWRLEASLRKNCEVYPSENGCCWKMILYVLCLLCVGEGRPLRRFNMNQSTWIPTLTIFGGGNMFSLRTPRELGYAKSIFFWGGSYLFKSHMFFARGEMFFCFWCCLRGEGAFFSRKLWVVFDTFLGECWIKHTLIYRL